jgi:hypothetical protein
MKYPKILLLFAVIFIANCKKDEKEPLPGQGPWLEINFGTESYSGLNFSSFKNQNSTPGDSIAAHKYFGVNILENNLPNLIHKDSMKFEFDAQTKNDSEHFNSKSFSGEIKIHQLIFNGAPWGVSDAFTTSTDFFIPYKFSSIGKPHNDTLEFISSGDFIKIDYQSQLSDLKGSDSIIIKP